MSENNTIGAMGDGKPEHQNQPMNAFSQYQSSVNPFHTTNNTIANPWTHQNTGNTLINPFNPLQKEIAHPAPIKFPQQTSFPVSSPNSSPTPTSANSMNNHLTSPSSSRNGDDTRQVGSDRKRNRRSLIDDNTLDDIMGQITSKLTHLTTTTAANEEESQHQSIAAFIEVLGCSANEATFFLESTGWDIQTAVVLWLENNPMTTSSSWSRQGTWASTSKASSQPRYRDLVVQIEGLDTNLWTAKVDPYDGCIYFWSHLTGNKQQRVPPGFADLPPKSMNRKARDLVSSTESNMSEDNNDDEDEETEAQKDEIADPRNGLSEEIFEDTNSQDWNQSNLHPNQTVFPSGNTGTGMEEVIDAEAELPGNDLGEGISLPSYPQGGGYVETHIFGTHSEYWKEDLPQANAQLRRRNNSANELFEVNDDDDEQI